MCTCLISLTGFVFLDRTEKLTGAYGIAYGTLRDAYDTGVIRNAYGMLTGCLRDPSESRLSFYVPKKEGRPYTEEGGE